MVLKLELIQYLKDEIINAEMLQKNGFLKSLQIYEAILSKLSVSPKYTTVRVNTLITTPEVARDELVNYLSRFSIDIHPELPDMLTIKSLDCDQQNIEPAKKEVIVDLKCGIAVLRGANVFAPGVLSAPTDLQEGDCAAVYVDLESNCLKGATSSFNGPKHFVGNGIVLISRYDLFVNKIVSGIAVRMTDPICIFPSFGDVMHKQLFLQNLPSIVCGHVVDPKPGEYILDMCAAPGGKTTHLGILMNNEGTIIALDKSRTKVKKINSNAARCEIGCIKTFAYDSIQAWDPQSSNDGMPPFPSETFDRILLDSPCSALGQRPQINNTMTVKELQSYPNIQRKLLHNAIQLLKVKGIMVYSTCTFTLQENEQMVKWVLCNYSNMQLDEQIPYLGQPGLPGAGLTEEHLAMVQRFGSSMSASSSNSSLEILEDTIGFFIAKFKKR